MGTYARLLVVVLVILALAPGCLVRSVEPWLKNDSLVFEEDLLGGWIGKAADGGEVAMTFLRGEGLGGYVVQYASKDGQGTFAARLGKFGSDYYLDFRPKEGAPGVDGLLLFPMHSVARLEIGTETLSVYVLNFEAVKNAAKLKRLRDLRYTWDDENELVLVSTTEELQRFLLGLGRDSSLFNPPIRLSRRK
jgi:hypothetical protein